MKLTKLIGLAFVGASITASSLLANTLSISYPSPKFDGSPDLFGGEFTVKTSDHGTFTSFCMEYRVDISLNTSYAYSIVDSVVRSQNDPLSVGTAKLFAAFNYGVLPGLFGGSYEGASNSDHDKNAGLLQTAFWMLEDETLDNNGNVVAANVYSNTNFYIKWLEDNFFGNQAGAQADYTGDNVKAVNIETIVTKRGEKGRDVQDVLIFVPDTGMTAALLGLGLLSLAAFRRKL